MDSSIQPSSVFGGNSKKSSAPRNDYNQSVHEKLKGILGDLGLESLEKLVLEKYNDDNLMEAGHVIAEFNSRSVLPIEIDNYSTYLYCVATAAYDDVFNNQERRDKLNKFAYEMHFYGFNNVSYPSETERVFAIERNFKMMFLLRNLKQFRENY